MSTVYPDLVQFLMLTPVLFVAWTLDFQIYQNQVVRNHPVDSMQADEINYLKITIQ